MSVLPNCSAWPQSACVSAITVLSLKPQKMNVFVPDVRVSGARSRLLFDGPLSLFCDSLVILVFCETVMIFFHFSILLFCYKLNQAQLKRTSILQHLKGDFIESIALFALRCPHTHTHGQRIPLLEKLSVRSVLPCSKSVT